jgi:hypothetical protein
MTETPAVDLDLQDALTRALAESKNLTTVTGVDQALRALALKTVEGRARVLRGDAAGGDIVAEAAADGAALAKAFVGQDPDYVVNPWNTSGQIASWVTRITGIGGTPEEPATDYDIVRSFLLTQVQLFHEVQAKVEQGGQSPEWAAEQIESAIEGATFVLLGIPLATD